MGREPVIWTWPIASLAPVAGTSRSRMSNAGRCDMLVAEVTQRQDILGSLEGPGAAMWCRSGALEPRRIRRQGEIRAS